MDGTASSAPGVDELMVRRVESLFRWSDGGRMVAMNQWDGGEAPRFYLARTRAGNVSHIREDVPDATAATLLDLAAREPTLEDLRSSPSRMADYLTVLRDGAEVASLETSTGPVYWFERDAADSGRTVPIDGGNAGLLRGGLAAWLPDVPHRQPMVAVVQDGRAVAVCASVRITARAHEAGVETDPGYRCRGHAARAVAGWARAVRAQGVALRFYSTSWDNVASQRVAAPAAVVMPSSAQACPSTG